MQDNSQLTQVAIKTRKVVRFGVYFVFGFLVLRFAFNMALNLKNTFFPKPPPPPTVGFDVLPRISFPVQNQNLPDLQYAIETPSGSLPTLPEQTRVYYMPRSQPSLNSVDQSRAIAARLGFNPNSEKISETVYEYSHTSKPSTLTMNIIWQTFSIAYNLAADISPLNSNPPTAPEALAIATSLLKRADIFYPQLEEGTSSHEFLQIESQKLVKAISLSEANLTKINIYRKSFGTEDNPIPNVTADPNESNVWFILSGSKDIIAAEYHFYQVDEETYHTYPLKTAEQALEELQQNKAFIASLGTNPEGNIIIRDIYLAYYDPDLPSQFYQPVIVFEGDGGFVAYVPAVSSLYYQAEESK